ncbi:MAG: DNA polymerase III subunit alpha [Candidatus Peribacter riflensis]|uniref:DNA polymerase III subunit alpha n=1 Tax=Candidatus Peribacter riflensis TaxID=1735162 RepID=A0A0S1SJ52_9BACT|nr:MAG: DNA polymerase III subunit alpha [Candidatus Peribacter riflensis]OGJ78447.1 MAG: DNA polymerase III subunit alpha [Candidatus Peribacteria bacterium RIFOXYB1_FULL_57_12]ALM11469.1 MAG: DNA polymerase III subunit alpha [Candidatus Peribacter riflensis]ALM12571.1 MAG: DNA polymerase III subunit alpha [Candidatus Peribacter riflensis]ALM13672.1 MAG: DNA polymerase III subunit alpha [Candidatus Peribacter riflensis]
MKATDFVHLHCHSTYSLLEALPSPEEIVERAKELGQTAVGIADKGYVYGLVEFYQAAKKGGLKPILGLETYVAARTRFDQESGTDTKRYPLVLLAENEEGYSNLLALATQAALEGMYYKPRVDAELLSKYGKGLIALTGPIGGAIPQAALVEDGERIQELTEQYRSYFGEKNLYFELMELTGVTGQAEVNQQLISWGKKLNVPLVATCSSHYCRPQDSEAHDVLLCIQKNANVADPTRFSMRDSDFSMRPFTELECTFAHVPEALQNTRVIADRCSVTLELGKYRIPRYPVPKDTTEESELSRLAGEGFAQRYPNATQEQKDRLKHELSVINSMGFAGYFLIVADFINEAKRRGIAVGPGRGSAAGSIVSYSLNITTLDPLEHGLLFERFLNPERISMPDIDTDFADTRRDEVLEYVRDKYGNDRVVQICTFGTLAARAAVKDVGRAYGVPFLEMNALAKLIPERPGTTLKDAMETTELKAAYDSNETYRKIIDTAFKLEGKARHVSVHACGVIITPEPTVHFSALQRAPKDENIIITQYEAKPLEALGLLKMDFLGLTNLTVIQTTLEIIQRLYGTQLDMANLPMNDKATYELLQRGDTTGVFQLESAGMRRYLKQLIPTTFNDITAMAALFRPGPMEWIPSFIKRKHGKEQVEYLHKDVEPIFRETYGIGVYQEQILQLARVFAGYSLGEADLLRRAIGKKIKKELDAQRDKFIAGAAKKGHGQALAEKIFDDVILPFAGYGFPKAHAAGYARIAFETAYLKAHFPTEFMAALLSSDAQRTDRVMIEIEECRQMSIQVLPPDINESLRHFTALPPEGATLAHGTAQKGSIRFGLSAIKGIGDSSVQQLIAVREAGGKFKSIEDFARRVPSKVLNKKLLEALVKSGALDSLGERRALVEHYELIIDYAKSSGNVSAAQSDLFASAGTKLDDATIEFPHTTEATSLQKLQWEKETLGMYVSSHPLAGLKKYIAKKAQLIADLTAKDAGKKIKLAGLVESIKRITTKKGETMAVILLEDPTGKIEATLFPRVYGEFANLLELPDSVLVVGGTIDMRAGQLQMRADALKRAVLSTMITHAKEEGFFDEEEAKHGLSISRKRLEETEQVELVDEEGNVIAGETVTLGNSQNGQDEFLGPLGQWLLQGMPTTEVLTALGFSAQESSESPAQADSSKPEKKTLKKKEGDAPTEPRTYSTEISIHTIALPERAPKKLLLDLKHVLETFPGKEKVQLKIGEQLIPLPLTINMSTILEKKIEEVLSAYASPAA